MATTSTIGTARAALKTALDSGALSGITYYAWPGPLSDQNELCWIGRVKDWDVSIPNIKAGRKQRQEEYTFEVHILAFNPGLASTGHQTVFERALVLAAVAQDTLANDVQLGGAVIQWAEMSDGEIDLDPYQDGWVCQVQIDVRCHARLT